MRSRPIGCCVVLVLLALASCGGDEGDNGSPTVPGSSAAGRGTSAATNATTTPPGTGAPPTTEAPVPTATISSDAAVEGSFRQGIAKADTGWVFSNALTLFRTDDAFVVTAKDEQAIPPEWAAQAFDHIGDIDVVGGTIYAPLEQSDYEAMRQAMVRYDAETFELLDVVEVAQSHNAWVAVDPDTMVAYSMSGFTDDAVLRYDVTAAWTPLEPIPLDRTVDRVQGGDLAAGYLWLSTDDATNGVYRVDLVSGAVVDLGSAGRVDGEGEGIDATDLATGELHVLVADPALVPMWVVHLSVS